MISTEKRIEQILASSNLPPAIRLLKKEQPEFRRITRSSSWKTWFWSLNRGRLGSTG